MIVTACPATVSDPDRALDELFAATENETVPLPFPDAPDVTVTKEALLVAVHAQPDEVVTFTVPAPPPDPKEAGFAAETEYVQEDPPNARTSATLASEPCEFEYTFTFPVSMSVIVIVYATSESAA